ncbi:hypothetical protein MJK72_03625 [Klebsiella pneumoniae]|nr:hypothetical protein MJK72_03625 [Klebsiella pneumoniae]
MAEKAVIKPSCDGKTVTMYLTRRRAKQDKLMREGAVSSAQKDLRGDSGYSRCVSFCDSWSRRINVVTVAGRLPEREETGSFPGEDEGEEDSHLLHRTASTTFFDTGFKS